MSSLLRLAREVAKEYSDAADWKDRRGELEQLAQEALSEVENARAAIEFIEKHEDRAEAKYRASAQVLCNLLKKDRKIFSGEVEVLLHRCMFWFNIHDLEQTYELDEELTDAARERIEHNIKQGNVCGELNHYYAIDTYGKCGEELRGWWEIKKD